MIAYVAPVAQWIEYLASDQGVVGSSPAGRTRRSAGKWKILIFHFRATLFPYERSELGNKKYSCGASADNKGCRTCYAI